ncbi:MAG: transcriptional regulator PpsR, partial [Mameliella sp.]|nr:transcriptional regulator PpsR [Mameliella sp.]
MTRQDASSEFEHVGILPDASSVSQIIEHTSDIAVHVDARDTVIGIFVSPECPAFGCLDHWVGRKFDTFLNVESKVKYAARRE